MANWCYDIFMFSFLLPSRERYATSYVTSDMPDDVCTHWGEHSLCLFESSATKILSAQTSVTSEQGI